MIPTERLLAVDLDLHRCHCWNDTDQDVFVIDESYQFLESRLVSFQHQHPRVPTTILVECASPHTYGQQLQKKRIAWMIWNSMICGRISKLKMVNVEFLFAPSSTWTKGYDEPKRHGLAGVEPLPGLTKDQNHNIGECRAMCWFYRQEPQVWLPWEEYQACL